MVQFTLLYSFLVFDCVTRRVCGPSSLPLRPVVLRYSEDRPFLLYATLPCPGLRKGMLFRVIYPGLYFVWSWTIFPFISFLGNSSNLKLFHHIIEITNACALIKT